MSSPEGQLRQELFERHPGIRIVEEINLDHSYVLVIEPHGLREDGDVSKYPVLGEGAGASLLAALGRARAQVLKNLDEGTYVDD